MINHLELKRQSDKIIKLIVDSENTFEEDDEMRSHLAKYICILCSGFLENAIQLIYSDYIRKEINSSCVISFAINTLIKIQNPNAEKFRAIAKSFKPEWEPLLKEFLQQEERSSAINYIITDRHKIAHGKNSEITLNRIKEYHLKTVEVIEFLEMQCELVSSF